MPRCPLVAAYVTGQAPLAHGLADAASIAGLLITTEAGVAEAPKKKEAHGHAHGAGMGGMGGMDM